MTIRELLEAFGSKYILAFFTTCRLTVISYLLALALGIVITVMRICPVKPLAKAGNGYVHVFRNIPGAALLILAVYALPYLDIVFSYGTCVLITTTLIPAAFCTEYLIAGINTIPPGQIEAARSLGMSFFKIVKNVVAPQALRSSVLPLTNLLVATMLTTAIASQVPLNPRDLTGIVTYINSRETGGIAAFAISAAVYFLASLLIGLAGNLIDRKVRIYR